MKDIVFKRHTVAGLVLSALAGPAIAASLEASAVGDFNGDGIAETDSDSVTGSPVAQTSVNVMDFGTASGYAFEYEGFADIAAGTLGAYARLDSSIDKTGIDGPLLRTEATIMDTLSFDSALAGAYDITIILGIAGIIENGDGRVQATATLGVGDGGSTFDSAFDSWGTDGDHVDTLSATVTVNGNVSLNLDTALAVEIFEIAVGSTTFGDFRGILGEDGPSITIVVPDGVTLSGSDSGAFDGPVVVPLPSALWLLLSSILGLLSLRQVQRR
ncbi:MAG: hypothetical protein U5S82_10155 [Gammaproteobacteria bacterium]|nr:hypothetical protein [Gammaproteobacteria bacterium]